MDKRFKISSVSNLWNPFEVTVDKKGYVTERSLGSPVEIGAVWKELKKYWESFSGDMGYKIEELKDEL